MCNGSDFQHWQAISLQYLLQDSRFELALLIVDKTPSPKKSRWKKITSAFFYNQYETRFLKVLSRKQHSLEQFLGSVPKLNCVVSSSGRFSQEVGSADVETINSHQLDFIIRFGFGILKGEILHASKWGVWSYHHGDPEVFRGGPPGFWEIYKSVPTTGAILQRLTPKLDQGIILHAGNFPTIKHCYSEQIDCFLYGTASWIKTAALNCFFGNIDPDIGVTQLKNIGTLYKRPSNFQFLVFLVILIIQRLNFHRIRYFYRDMWQLGMVVMHTEKLLHNQSIAEPSWLAESPNKDGYRADPFAFENEKEITVVYEEYDYKKKQASIAAIAILSSTGKQVELGPVINSYHHLSYPFVFEANDSTYLLPEAWRSGKLSLYQWSDHQVVKVKDILTDFKAIDPTLLFHDGLFWLFCTERSAPSHQLYLFYSETIDGEYTAHQLNPVKSEVNNSRPAGTPFKVGDKLYRPAQNCSLTYGGSIVINQIQLLSKTAFLEVPVNEITPDRSWKWNKGLHTISILNNCVIFDAKRTEFHFNPRGN